VVVATSVMVASHLVSLCDPVVKECQIWRAIKYAEKAASRNPLARRWKTYIGELRNKDRAQKGKQLLALCTGDESCSQLTARLSSLEPMQLYDGICFLTELCGFDSEGRDIKTRGPMKHYSVAFNIAASEGAESMATKMALHKQVYDFAREAALNTETDFVSHSVEGAALKQVSASFNEKNNEEPSIVLGDGECTLGVGFKATDEFAAVMANKFPQIDLLCLETRKMVRSATRCLNHP